MKKIAIALAIILVLAAVAYFIWRISFYYRAIQNGENIYSADKFSSMTVGKKTSVATSGVKILPKKDSPSLGNPQATITIVEFADFTCPFSKEAFMVMRELLTKYPEKINFVFRFFPLGDEMHKGGEEAARAAFCAAKQGKFWQFHDKLFLNQKNFITDDLRSYSGQVGLNASLFDNCLNAAETKAVVERDLMDGFNLGVSGTPTFFINGKKAEGAIPLDAWEKFLKKY